MRNFLDSIANRMFIILLAGVLLAAAVTMLLAGRERERAIDDMRVGLAADRIEQLVLAIDAAAPTVRPVILQTATSLGLQARIVAAPSPEMLKDSAANETPLSTALATRFGAAHPVRVQADVTCPRSAARADRADHADRPIPAMCPVILIGLDGAGEVTTDGWVRVQLRPSPAAVHGRMRNSLAPPPPYLILFLALIGALAYHVARMTARPISTLAKAAGALGRDLDRAPLVESGPTEIRQAASAFNAMQARIRRQVQHRTHMLAAITHDLQTPLTRLRLRLEKVSDTDLQAKLISDLGVMQSMVQEGLELARSMDSQEKFQRLDIDSLVDSVCADASDAGQDVQVQGCPGLFVMAQPNALRRCLTNLLDNATKYGKQARVSLVRLPHSLHPAHSANSTLPAQPRCLLLIHDAGPGLPADMLETVFEPFFRLETSRSRDTGGTGLGLTIARNIALNHGGELALRNHPAGGLEVQLQLPLTAAQAAI